VVEADLELSAWLVAVIVTLDAAEGAVQVIELVPCPAVIVPPFTPQVMAVFEEPVTPEVKTRPALFTVLVAVAGLTAATTTALGAVTLRLADATLAASCTLVAVTVSLPPVAGAV
jgi:hypothetical protein